MRRPRPALDIAAVIGLKLILLTALYYLFFAGSTRAPIDGASVARHLLSSAEAAP